MQKLVDVQCAADRDAGPIHDFPLRTTSGLLFFRGGLEDCSSFDGILEIRAADDVRRIRATILNDVDVVLRRVRLFGSRSVDEQTFADLNPIPRFEDSLLDF